jgi:hypothetical protein
MLGGCMNELESDEFEAALLEAADDVADETALDAIRLERGDSSLHEHNRKQDVRSEAATHLDHNVCTLVDGHD